MKKTVKRLVALMLVLVLAFSLAACKKEESNNSTTKKPSGDNKTEATLSYEKPTSIKVMWDGTILKEGEENTDALYKAYEEAYGLKINWVRPFHDTYADSVSQAFASGDVPDVLLLSAGQYVSFAARGFLYDMSKDWEASGMMEDSRFSENIKKQINEMYYVEGKNGEDGLYGMPTTRGNGCITYVRKSWLDAIGKKAEDIKTYADYYNMLVAMKEKKNAEYVVTGAGYITNEAPYTNYLPEFYQSAYPDFLEKDGKWVDGFTEPEMKAALERLTAAYAAKLLDPQLNSNGTKQARNNLIDNKCGVFTYWAGTWYDNLSNSIANKGEYADGDLTYLKPISEVGAYIERMAPVVAILKDAPNAAGIYKYFVEPIYDGDKVMTVWMFGAKGAQWDNVAETITLKGKEYKYEEGQFHWKLNGKGDKFLAKNNIDPLLAICEFQAGKNPAGEMVKATIARAYEAQMMFNENCKPAPAVKSNAVLTISAGDIMAKRKEVATAIIEGKMTYDAGMAEYKKAVGDKIELCLESLNEE